MKRLGYELERVLFADDTPRNLERDYGNHVGIARCEGVLHDEELLWLASCVVRIAAQPNLRSLEKRRWRAEIADGPYWPRGRSQHPLADRSPAGR